MVSTCGHKPAPEQLLAVSSSWVGLVWGFCAPRIKETCPGLPQQNRGCKGAEGSGDPLLVWLVTLLHAAPDCVPWVGYGAPAAHRCAGAGCCSIHPRTSAQHGQGLTPATQHRHLRGALSKAQTTYILLNGISWSCHRAGRSSCSLCQPGSDSLRSHRLLHAFVCNTEKSRMSCQGWLLLS